MKFIQDEIDEPNSVQRRMLHLIKNHQIREVLMDKDQKYKEQVKIHFDKKANQQIFFENDLVLCWDVKQEDRGKHSKFDNLWFGPFKVVVVLENNTLLLKHLVDDQLVGGPVNGHFHKKFFTY